MWALKRVWDVKYGSWEEGDCVREREGRNEGEERIGEYIPSAAMRISHIALFPFSKESSTTVDVDPEPSREGTEIC